MNGKSLKVLFVEDNPRDEALIKRHLIRCGYELESQRVETDDAFTEALKSHEWDLVISDYSLPTFSAIRALFLLKAIDIDIPFIIISGTIGEDVAVEAMRLGANDYLMKDSLARLEPAIEREREELKNRRARKKAEENVHEREKQLAEAQRLTHIGSWSWDLVTDTLSWSDELFRIFGLKPSSAAPSYAELQEKFIYPEDVEFVDESLQKAFADGKPFDFTYRLKRPDGSLRYLHALGQGITDKTGKSIKYFGTAQDVTDQKETEKRQQELIEALQESEERYRLLFSSNPIPMWAYDLETFSFLEVNDAAMISYGYSRDEFLSMKITDIRSSDEAEKLVREIESINSVLSQTKIWKHKKKDESIISVEVTAHSLDFNGRSARLVLANDVSERRLLEDQLRQAQKLEAIGMLAGGIAHDFNNLLTVINGYAELLLQTVAADWPYRENLEDIHSAGERAASLTHQLLAFSRKQVLEPKVIDLNGIILDLEKLLRRVIGENIDFRTVLDEKLGSVNADPGQIEQIVMNLAINSRDAMPNGGKLTIETSNEDLDDEYARSHISVKPGRYIMLAVSDTGTGMDEVTKARIFEPFFSTKAVGKGTGLGLSTAYGIVKQSGGNIWVYSEPGLGTTFKVYLPVVDKPSVTDERHVVQVPALGSETILLVEDDDLVRKFAANVLTRLGYNVLTAASGREALDICRDQTGNPIALLLTDVVMPEMSGRELAEKVEDHCSNIKILYMSGYTDNAIVHQGVIDEGANFIHKPFNAEAFARKVREVLDLASE